MWKSSAVLTYYIVLSSKMEELFAVKDKLFAQTVQKTKRKQAKRNKMQQNIRPKVPKGAQEPAAGGKEKDGAARKTEQLIDPKFSARHTQSKEKQQRRYRQAIEDVEGCGGKACLAAQAQRPQQIIQQTKRPAQQYSLQRKAQLQKAIDLHGAAFQPKSRCKKPRRDSCSS